MEDTHQNGESNTPTSPPVDAAAVAELKAKYEQLAIDNARLMGRMEQMSTQQSAPHQVQHQPKQITPEEYKKLFDENPAEAVKLAVQGVVSEQVNPLLENERTLGEKVRWDEKAEREFPAMVTDPEFKKLVKETAADLMTTDRLPKNHPTLLYRAAQLAAAKLGRKTAPTQGGLSGEAPNSSPRDPGAAKFKLPSDFDAMSKMFGITDESKKRLAQKLEAQAKIKAEREKRRFT